MFKSGNFFLALLVGFQNFLVFASDSRYVYQSISYLFYTTSIAALSLISMEPHFLQLKRGVRVAEWLVQSSLAD